MIAPSDHEHSAEDDANFHVSPDGLLALRVVRDVDGEELIGFHGFDWSVQIRILSELSGVPAEAAKQAFIDKVLSDVAIIAILKTQGVMMDAWVTEEPHIDLKFLKAHEEIEFRYWSGARPQI